MNYKRCLFYVTAINNFIKDEKEVYNKLKDDLTQTGVGDYDTFWDSVGLSYAKINLTLNIDPASDINAKYLELCSLIQKISWGNQLYIKKITNDEAKSVEKYFNPTEEHDFLLLNDYTPEENDTVTLGYPFDSRNILSQVLSKVRRSDERYIVSTRRMVPIGTGLGGGSADAAFLLKTLDPSSVMNVGSSIVYGSDVPFLLSDHNLGLVASNGDDLLGVQDLSYHGDVYLLIPNVSTSTEAVFKRARELISQGVFRGFDRSSKSLKIDNDLEDCIVDEDVLELYQILNRCHEKNTFGMSGSGSTFFILSTTDDNLDDKIKSIRKEYKKPLAIVKTSFKRDSDSHNFKYL